MAVKRWAFNILAGASLALTVVTALLWARSYRHMEGLRYEQAPAFVHGSNLNGRVVFSWSSAAWPHSGGQWRGGPVLIYEFPGVSGPTVWDLGPVEMWDWGSYRDIDIRHWFLVLLFSLPPAAWLLRGPLLRRRRRKLGLCRHCGYDLRATPGRCPECGRENSPSPLPPKPRHLEDRPLRPDAAARSQHRPIAAGAALKTVPPVKIFTKQSFHFLSNLSPLPS